MEVTEVVAALSTSTTRSALAVCALCKRIGRAHAHFLEDCDMLCNKDGGFEFLGQMDSLEQLGKSKSSRKKKHVKEE
jgi:hypothetical protein